MKINISALMMVCAAMLVTGAAVTAFQLYKIVQLDARARNLNHPKFWGLIAANGNNSSGLLWYLITRRKYPIINMTDEIYREIETGKKRSYVGLIFMVLGAIGSVVLISMM